MPDVQKFDSYIDLAKQIVLRQATQRTRGIELLTLATFVRFSVVWRTNVHSGKAAQKLWSVLEGNQGINMETLISMTSEFIVRCGTVPSALPDILAQSLVWSSKSTAAPEAVSTLTAGLEDYKKTFTDNPWLTFLYLLSMSDIVQELSSLPYPPEPKRPRGESE